MTTTAVESVTETPTKPRRGRPPKVRPEVTPVQPEKEEAPAPSRRTRSASASPARRGRRKAEETPQSGVEKAAATPQPVAPARDRFQGVDPEGADVPRFVQIHFLTSYPAALLNRDESGQAKRMMLGGHSRTRISSQCQKRHWITTGDKNSLSAIPNAEPAYRSRNTVEKRIIEPLRSRELASEEVLDALAKLFNTKVYGSSGESEAKRQPLLLGRPEVEYLSEQAAAAASSFPDDPEGAVNYAVEQVFQRRAGFEAFRQTQTMAGGITAALFGRMVTSDPKANIDAAIHVAHAFTVHAEESETDYFTVVDDLADPEKAQAADHIGESEINAGLFYGYVVVDLPALISNTDGCAVEEYRNRDVDRTLAAETVGRLCNLIAQVSPGAKKGATAPYAWAQTMMVEAGDRQPRSLSEAFRQPVKADLAPALDAMADQLENLDRVYGNEELRRFICLQKGMQLSGAQETNQPGLVRWIEEVVKEGIATR